MRKCPRAVLHPRRLSRWSSRATPGPPRPPCALPPSPPPPPRDLPAASRPPRHLPHPAPSSAPSRRALLRRPSDPPTPSRRPCDVPRTLFEVLGSHTRNATRSWERKRAIASALELWRDTSPTRCFGPLCTAVTRTVALSTPMSRREPPTTPMA